jgi:cell division protease FtsH
MIGQGWAEGIDTRPLPNRFDRPRPDAPASCIKGSRKNNFTFCCRLPRRRFCWTIDIGIRIFVRRQPFGARRRAGICGVAAPRRYHHIACVATASNIIVMAATNTPEVLDPALVRPGRFDRQVAVDRADMAGREAILRIHARKISLAPEVSLRTIAARTPGMVGADLANIVNEAAILGARRNADVVTMADLEAAIDRVMLGLEKNRVMSAAIKERVAYHETGHALVALKVRHADPVHRVSIIPRTIGALGHVLQLPEEEKYLMTQPEIEDQIAVILGGRASEEIIFDGVVSTGASNDLERASGAARQIVTRYGMSERLGLMTYGRSSSSHLAPAAETGERDYSERTAELIDEEARRILDTIYGRVRRILQENRAELEKIARKLMERETLTRDDLNELLDAKHRAAAMSSL